MQNRFHRVLLGQAVGDAIGLPMEGLSRKAIAKRGWMKPLRHRFFRKRGMISDDTEHMQMTAEALLAGGGDADRFERSLAWRMRWWFLGFPAGVGLATLRACVKLWLGFGYRKAGVFSAGNGPAMRAGIIGVYFSDDTERRNSHLKAAVEITHSDPKALTASRAVCELAARFHEVIQSGDEFSAKELTREVLQEIRGDDDWLRRCSIAINTEISLLERLKALDCEERISGYIYQGVPAIIAIGMEYRWEYKQCVEEVIEAGGDTDTNAAIMGCLCGAMASCIPSDWEAGLSDLRGNSHIRDLADRMERGITAAYSLPFALLIVVRNVCFVAIVLCHGFARLFR